MRKTLAIILAASPLQAFSQKVDLQSLLPEMTDLGRLASRPKPNFIAAQASSWDRRTKDTKTEWFAKADAGQFIRTEQNEGRTEFVMADLVGPGTVTRIWSANPGGTIRFYFDGEVSPRLSFAMEELLTGKIAAFPDPFAYIASRGTNLYFPFPYAKSLKITAEARPDSGIKGLYYHVGYRTYGAGTQVTSFTMDQLAASKESMSRVAKTLMNPDSRPMPRTQSDRANVVLASGKSHIIDLPEGPRAIYELRVRVAVKPGVADNPNEPWGSPLQLHNALRRVIMMATFDEDFAINVPIGDFFGSAPGINPYKSFPMEVSANGWMVSRFIMPYAENAGFVFVNEGEAPVSLEVEIKHAPRKWSAGDYHFFAQWNVDQGMSHPQRDMTFLDAKGEGLWIGSNLAVANPTPAWWGEGDEKVFVDGEAFPSTFGTGTEDYYGYAWSSAELFQRPYHAQPRADGPANYGHSSVNRWHILDPIPYTKSLRFDMEIWHWANVYATYARTSYWYAAPGGTEPIQLNRSLILPPYVEPPKGVEGAIEGEKLKIVQVTGGIADSQGGFVEISRGEQLWWRQMKKGDKLVLRVPIAQPGTYEIIGNFCTNQDYGIHSLSINGRSIGEPMDFWSSTLKWEKRSLGVFELTGTELLLEVVSQGSREGALPGGMFGLDYLIMNKR